MTFTSFFAALAPLTASLLAAICTFLIVASAALVAGWLWAKPRRLAKDLGATRKQVQALTHTEEALRRQKRYRDALNEVTYQLISRLDIHQLLRDILVRAVELLDTLDGFFDLINPKTQQLESAAAIGFMNDEPDIPLKMGETLLSTRVLSRCIWR
jgi:hypothetical protein